MDDARQEIVKYHVLIVESYDLLDLSKSAQASISGWSLNVRLWNRRKSPCNWETMVFSSLRGSPMRARRGSAGVPRQILRVGSPPPSMGSPSRKRLPIVHVRLVVRPASVNVVEVESRGAEIGQSVGIVCLIRLLIGSKVMS